MQLLLFFFLRFTNFEIVFVFSFRHKNFKKMGSAKARLLQIDRVEITSDRSSRMQMSFKTGDLFRNIHKKALVLQSLFNKVGVKFFIKKRLQHRWYCKIFKNTSTGEYCKIFKNSFCYITPVAAFDLTQLYTLNN